VQGEWQRTVCVRGNQPGQFKGPQGLALTSDEDFLLVADGSNCRVAVLRALDGAWVRQLTGPPGTLQNPVGVAVVTSTGEVLVSDIGRDLVIRFCSIDDDMVVGTLGTGLGSGPSEFYHPFGLVVLDGVNCPVVSIFICHTNYTFFNIFVIIYHAVLKLYVPTCDGALSGRPRSRCG
jgi:hypothetical protein